MFQFINIIGAAGAVFSDKKGNGIFDAAIRPSQVFDSIYKIIGNIKQWMVIFYRAGKLFPTNNTDVHTLADFRLR